MGLLLLGLSAATAVVGGATMIVALAPDMPGERSKIRLVSSKKRQACTVAAHHFGLGNLEQCHCRKEPMVESGPQDQPDSSSTQPESVADGTNSKRPLGSRFYRLFAGSIVSNLGDGMALVAYPWLASAITRNPFLIAMIAAAQRLPWLVFTLPAGVITDRVDRRKAMISMDLVRGVTTLVVAVGVLGRQGVLPGPDEVDQVTSTNTGLYLLVLLATLLLGSAEVLRDNANQTILPDIVDADQLERANGRIWGAESVANQFAGPPLGSLLLLTAFSLPFFVDAATFFVAAALVATIPGSFRADRPADESPQSFREELREGVGWLMAHPLLRPMAIMLGLMNLAVMIHAAVFVLFAQEVLGIGPLLFALVGFGGAIGALVGGSIAPRVSERLGSGAALAVAVGGMTIIPLLIGWIAWWPVVFVLFAIDSLFVILWNVITVSLRQSIIPPRLLGRVNSVYRFFAWGMIPIGGVISGVLVWFVERTIDRDAALRSTWFAAAAILAVIFFWCRSALTTEKIEAARTSAPAENS
jgi:MFS family permease